VDSQLNKFSSKILAHQSLQFPIQLRIMTMQECKEYHLRKLYELSIKSWTNSALGQDALNE